MIGCVCKSWFSENFHQFHSSFGYDSIDLKILVRWIIANCRITINQIVADNH